MVTIVKPIKDEDKTYVDPYSSDLFFNHNLDNYNALDMETASYEELFEALVADATEFIEIVDSNFGGLSIDYTPEDYARNFIEERL